MIYHLVITLMVSISVSAFAEVTDIKGLEALEKFQSDKGAEVLVLDFWFNGCAPCKKIKPTIESIGADKALSKNVRVGTVDITEEENEAVKEKFGVEGVPVVLFLRKVSGQWKVVRSNADADWPKDYVLHPEKIRAEFDKVLAAVKTSNDGVTRHAPSRTH